MSQQDIIRAWRDTDYRQSLSEAEQALIPPHPAGLSGTQMATEKIPVSPFTIYYSCFWICDWI